MLCINTMRHIMAVGRLPPHEVACYMQVQDCLILHLALALHLQTSGSLYVWTQLLCLQLGT